MANEIKAVYETGATLDFSVYYDDAGTLTEREVDQAMTEQPAGSGLYKGTPAVIEAGDIVVIEEGAVIIGSNEYYPEVNVKEVNGTAQTANDNGLDINTLITQIGTAGAGLTDLGGMSTTMKGQVQTEANDALVANNLDHLMKVATSDRDTLPEVVDDTVLANILTKTDGDTSDYDHATDSLEALKDNQVTLGSGAITFTYSLFEDEALETDPIANATVWVTTDIGGTDVIASGTTNASGAVTFYLDNNTRYYMWRQKSGFNFTNPDTEDIGTP